MDTQNNSTGQNQAVNVHPVPPASKSLRAALIKLHPMLNEAKGHIARLPLRDIVDPLTGISNLARFATAEELQRIVMECTKGHLMIDTLPNCAGSLPVVTANISVLTETGYIVLPGQSASQAVQAGIGEKALLAAESRAIRRALREVGLRAEYEVYDNEELAAQNRPKTSQSDENDENQEPETTIPSGAQDIEFDGEIPDTMPDDIAAVQKKESPSSGKEARSRSKRKQVRNKRQPAKKTKVIIPDSPLQITAEKDHDNWPDVHGITYTSDLYKALDQSRKKLSLKVGDFIGQVLGKETAASSSTLKSCITEDLEALFQFYIIQNGEDK